MVAYDDSGLKTLFKHKGKGRRILDWKTGRTI
jgi:hypothetical protein